MSKKQINKKGEGGGGGHCSHVIAKRQLRDHFIFKWAFCTKGLGWVSRQTTFKQGKVITMVIKTIWTTKGTIIEQVGFVDCSWFISIRNACIELHNFFSNSEYQEIAQDSLQVYYSAYCFCLHIKIWSILTLYICSWSVTHV